MLRLVILPFIFFALHSQSQRLCSPKELPFRNGEQVIYNVEYKMGKSWVSAGKARFIVKDSIYNDQSCIYVEGKGRSLQSYDWFFKVRDKYASFFSKNNFKPVYFQRRVREGDFSLDYDYNFDFNNLKSYVKERRKSFKNNDTIEIIPCSYDIMTAVYLSRTINFKEQSLNDSTLLDIILDKEIFNDVAIVYKGEKNITTQFGKKVNCIHFQIELIEGTIFKGNEKMDVFVTNDENKVPIYVEAEIIVGSIRAYAKSIKGTKEPIIYLN